MGDDFVEFQLQAEEVVELDRLAVIYGRGDRSEFLHEAIRFMVARERAVSA